MGDKDWQMPIHNKCGLPAELCTCPDAEVKFVKKDKTIDIWLKLAYIIIMFATIFLIVMFQTYTIEDKIFNSDTYEYNGKTYRIIEEK